MNKAKEEIVGLLKKETKLKEINLEIPPDPKLGDYAFPCFVLSKEYKPSEVLSKELQEHVKKTTAPYKYPRIIEYVEELPKTISGKILRRELRKNK